MIAISMIDIPTYGGELNSQAALLGLDLHFLAELQRIDC
jgi:hypothetical protein